MTKSVDFEERWNWVHFIASPLATCGILRSLTSVNSSSVTQGWLNEIMAMKGLGQSPAHCELLRSVAVGVP